jgi:hypothetical protein
MNPVAELKRAAANIRTILDHLENLASIAEAIDAVTKYLEISTSPPMGGTEGGEMPQGTGEMTLYSMRDPRWRHLCYHGTWTFGAFGCYTVGACMIASLAGYTDDPPTFARKIAQAGAFEGGELLWPGKIADVYPKLEYAGRLNWINRPLTDDELDRFKTELDKGPMLLQVDFYPGGALNPHFVVAEQLTPDETDVCIADPWDGTCTRLLERYASAHWDLKRALYGARLLRPARLTT